MKLECRRKLGRYELLHELGSGGMATVYAARAKSALDFERLVAVKCCHPHLMQRERFRTMFLDEARLAGSVHHPNVVAVIDTGQEDEQVFLVMDYVDGERLSRLLMSATERGQRLPVAVVVRLVRDVLAGLHAAHEAVGRSGQPLCLIHRDVTPENVLVGTDGLGRVIDFGIARALERETRTATGVLKGKLAYVAPEQLLGDSIDRRVDLWSLGVCLWESLVGKRLFGASSHAQVVSRVMETEIAPPSSLRPEVPAALDRVVLRALQRSPEARWSSALEMAAALEDPTIPVASPREVSQVVAALVGDELEERRRLLRRALDERSVENDAVVSVVDSTGSGTEPTRVRRPGVLTIIAPLVAAVVIGALAAVTSGERPEATSVEPTRDAVAAPVRTPPGSMRPEQAPAEPEPEVVPESSSDPALTEEAEVRDDLPEEPAAAPVEHRATRMRARRVNRRRPTMRQVRRVNRRRPTMRQVRRVNRRRPTMRPSEVSFDRL